MEQNSTHGLLCCKSILKQEACLSKDKNLFNGSGMCFLATILLIVICVKNAKCVNSTALIFLASLA